MSLKRKVIIDTATVFDEPLPFAEFNFRTRDDVTVGGKFVPEFDITKKADENGHLEVELITRANSLVPYRARCLSIKKYRVHKFDLAPGGDISFSDLLNLEIISQDESAMLNAAQLLDNIIEAHEAKTDPHPNYLNITRGDDRYSQTGHTHTTGSIAEGATNKYFTTGRVLAAALTGISFAAETAIAATDTVLNAFGKLQAQINRLIQNINDVNANLDNKLTRAEPIESYAVPSGDGNGAVFNSCIRASSAGAGYSASEIKLNAETVKIGDGDGLGNHTQITLSDGNRQIELVATNGILINGVNLEAVLADYGARLATLENS